MGLYEGIEQSDYDQISSKVYPNPASSSLIIEFDNPERRPYQLAIYDNLGRQVLLLDVLSDNQVELNVEEYKPGLFFYKLLNAEEQKGSWGKFLID